VIISSNPRKDATVSEPTSYMNMQAGDMLQALGDDASKWADAFRELHPEIDHETMFGWFANAIEHSSDVRRGRLFRSDEAFCDFVDDLMMHRRFLRDLDAAA
jgi:hypothetical protein